MKIALVALWVGCTCGGDCNDAELLAFPGGVETCNGVDDDCNGTADDGTECGDGCTADTYGGHVYLFCPNSLDWVAARRACRAIGYNLVALGDASEEVWVSDTARAVSGDVWWSGFNDLDLEGDFVWSSGEPVLYSNWAGGEPNNSGEEDCAQLLWSGYAWNDAACDSALPYVCEML